MPGATRPGSSTQRSAAPTSSSWRCTPGSGGPSTHGEIYATHTRRARRRRGGGGGRGPAYRRALGCAPSVSHLIPRNGSEWARRCVEPSSRRAGRRSRCCLRHAHPAVRGHVPARRAPAAGAAGRPNELRRRMLDQAARDGDARVPEHAQRRGRLDPGWCCSTTRCGPSTRAGTSRRSPPTGAGRPDGGLRPARALRSHDPRRLMVLIACYSEREQHGPSPIRCACRARTPPRWRPTGRSPRGSFTAPTRWAAWYRLFTVREERVLALAEAMHRLTGTARRPARPGGPRRAAPRRGRPTWRCSTRTASPETATTFEPNRLATGMVHVLVNGELTLRGRRTHRPAGRGRGAALRAGLRGPPAEN